MGIDQPAIPADQHDVAAGVVIPHSYVFAEPYEVSGWVFGQQWREGIVPGDVAVGEPADEGVAGRLVVRLTAVGRYLPLSALLVRGVPRPEVLRQRPRGEVDDAPDD